MTMFEDIPSAQIHPRHWKGLAVGVVVVAALATGGYFFLKYWSPKQARARLAELNRALAAYHERYQGYPDSLARLRGVEQGDPAAGQPERARLLPAVLAQDDFERDGYRFRYQPGQRQQRWAATVPLYSSYRLTAEPVRLAGRWFFYSDQNGEVRGREGEPAGPDDPVMK
jgi:hypothetical protein